MRTHRDQPADFLAASAIRRHVRTLVVPASGAAT
jgi:hypothetical protein